MRFKAYKHFRSLNPSIPAWRILEYIKALERMNRVKKALQFLK